MIALALFLSPALADEPADQMTFKGKVLTEGRQSKGVITISTNAIGIERKTLLKRESHTYTFEDMKALHVTIGLFKGTIQMDMGDSGDTVIVTLAPKYAKMAKPLLQDKV